MEMAMRGIALVVVDHKKGAGTTVQEVGIQLDLSQQFDASEYHNEDGTLNENGAISVAKVFVQGLNSAIQYAHKKGYKDSAEHLREAISELEEAFIQVQDIVPKDQVKRNKPSESQ